MSWGHSVDLYRRVVTKDIGWERSVDVYRRGRIEEIHKSKTVMHTFIVSAFQASGS